MANRLLAPIAIRFVKMLLVLAFILVINTNAKHVENFLWTVIAWKTKFF